MRIEDRSVDASRVDPLIEEAVRWNDRPKEPSPLIQGRAAKARMRGKCGRIGQRHVERSGEIELVIRPRARGGCATMAPRSPAAPPSRFPSSIRKIPRPAAHRFRYRSIPVCGGSRDGGRPESFRSRMRCASRTALHPSRLCRSRSRAFLAGRSRRVSSILPGAGGFPQ